MLIYYNRIITFIVTLPSLMSVFICNINLAYGQPLEQDNKAKVMILGTAHFDNPGQDLVNPEFPDVTAPEYQEQIKTVIDSLAKFEPTKIAVEVRPPYEATFDSLYQAYLKGTHELSRGEQQQLGFRLAKQFDHH